MSDFNYRGKLPFRIISSSVNTGYNAELTTSVGRNIEVVDQHTDHYAALQDSPMQGPFTETWVGGNQHRHADLNDGTDNASNRPEAFLISGSSNKVRVYGPAHFNEMAPKAVLTREEVAKRPLNIKNIATLEGKLGNFSHNYEVVQTSGRDINQSLIQNNLTASGVLTTKFVEGVKEYALPDLTNKNKSVFVERFSAPGDKKESSRGALDRESEQYSPNNSLITRNIGVRQPYYNQLTQHSVKSFLSKLNFLDTSIVLGGIALSLTFGNDGLSLYTTVIDKTFQFNLTKKYDVSTAEYRGVLAVPTGCGAGIAFDDTGNFLYQASSITGIIKLYTLSVPWDISTAVFTSDLTGFNTSISGILFADNGNKFYTISSTTKIIKCYTLTTQYVPNSANPSTTFTDTSDIQICTGIAAKNDGKNIYVTDRYNGNVYDYTLSTAHDVSTAILTKKHFLGISGAENFDLFLEPQTNQRLFILDRSNQTLDCYINFINDYATEEKINKNSITRIKQVKGFNVTTGLSKETHVTSSLNDNFWVQHSIPRTELRYKWIADSYVPSLTSPFFEYQRIGTDSEEIIFNSSSFARSGSSNVFAVDNIGLNSLIKDKKSINITNNTFTVVNPSLSASYSEIVNTPYGFSTWKQLRTGEHPTARKLRVNNVVSIEDSKSKVINGVQLTSRYSDNVRQYTEPPVTSKFKPLQQTLELKANKENYVFTYTHGNNLSTFVNTEIIERLGINENSQQMHDLLRKYYIAQNRKNDIKNPFNDLINYKYSETLYPREINAYMAETRGRTQYILDQAGTASRDGFDIQLGTQRAFWRDRLEDRKHSSSGFYNSMNYLVKDNYTTQSVTGTGSMFADFSNPPASVLFYPIEYDYRQTRNSSSAENKSFKIFDNNLNNKSEIYNNSICLMDILFSTTSIIEIYKVILANDNGCSGELNTETFLDYYHADSAMGVSYDVALPSQLTRVTPSTVINQYDNRNYTSGSYYSYSSFLTDSAGLITNAPRPRPNYVAFIGGFESGSRETDIGEFNINSYQFFNQKPTAPIVSTLDSGLRYATESFGDKKPWFNTYEDYIDDIRPLAKDHSIIPEFRISSNMPYYVTNRGGNFRSPNKAFLEIDGIGQNYRSAAIPQLQVYDQNFINSYVTTDAADYSTKLESDNRPVAKPESIKFTISGIKKLLPYNGFYPQERTIQLAGLFDNFLDQNVGGGYVKYFSLNGTGFSGWTPTGAELIINITESTDLFSKNSALPHFFSPGILYNTIKSGISVDSPAIVLSDNFLFNFTTQSISTSLGLQTFRQTQDIYPSGNNTYTGVASSLVNGAISNRFNFESLIFPQDKIPVNTNLTGNVHFTSSNSGTVVALAKQLLSGTLVNIKFDCNANPDQLNNVKTVGNTNFISTTNWKNTVPFCYLKKDTIIDPSYSMAMSNFLAEIPTFFLKQQSADRDQHLNVFRSAELKDWKTFQLGKKYYLDVKMKKSSDLVMMEAYRSEYHVTGNNAIEKTFNGRYFGWPVSKMSGTVTSSYSNYVVHNDPAYAPFTPPYFEGEAILRFELSASVPRYDNVKDLFVDLKLVDIFNELGQSAHTASEAYLNKMSIQDCMEVFGLGRNPSPTYASGQNPASFDGTPNTSTEYWSISPKLETPVLDFSDQEFVAHTGSYWVSSGYGRGMWSGYGKIPTGSKGITIEMAESFPLQNNGRTNVPFDPRTTGSLLDQVGFRAQSSKIGQLADIKEISEAIVAIPYVDKPITGVTTFIDGHHFIAIDRNIYTKLKSDVELSITSSIPGQPAGYESSITKMIKSMDNYVIPPNFNFSKYNINPFVMYVFEFKHQLDQQDLADIWQGVMPKIAYKAEEDQVIIDHKFGPYELFGENFSTPENLRWMIFKVKKKAEWNYFAITENIGDDNRFKFNFANSQVAQTPDYSYNWPYDYFSLVELAKVDITMEYSGSQPMPLQTAVTVVNGNTAPFQTAVTIVDNTPPAATSTNPITRKRATKGVSLDLAQKTTGKFK